MAVLISEDPLMNLHSQPSFPLLWIILVSLISFATSLFTSKSPLNVLNGTSADTKLLWDMVFFQGGNCLLMSPLLDPFQQRCDTAAVPAWSQPTAGAAARSQHRKCGLRTQGKMQVVNILKNTLLVYETIGYGYFAGKSIKEMSV